MSSSSSLIMSKGQKDNELVLLSGLDVSFYYYYFILCSLSLEERAYSLPHSLTGQGESNGNRNKHNNRLLFQESQISPNATLVILDHIMNYCTYYLVTYLFCSVFLALFLMQRDIFWPLIQLLECMLCVIMPKGQISHFYGTHESSERVKSKTFATNYQVTSLFRTYFKDIKIEM